MSPSEKAVRLYNATIADTGKASATILMNPGEVPVGIYFPAIDTSTAFNFDVAGDNTTSLVAMQDGSGVAYAKTIDNTKAGYVPLDQNLFRGIKAISIKVADAQTGAKSIKLAVATP